MGRLKGNLIFILSLVVLLMIIISGCENKEDETISKDSEKDILIIGQDGNPKSLDPHTRNDEASLRVIKQIYNTLVDIDENMEVKPGLAKDWERIDDNTWRFNLEEGVKFHNGEELKSKDVKFSLDRIKDLDEVSQIIGQVSSVEIEDDYTIIIRTYSPFSPLLSHLANINTSIVNEKTVTEYGEDYKNNPVGTGPYKLIEYDIEDKVSLERFDNYYRDNAKIKKIEFRNISEETRRIVGLEKREVDIAYEIGVADKEDVILNKYLELLEIPSLSLSYIGFNTQTEPLYSTTVRQAIIHGIDVEKIIKIGSEKDIIKADSILNPKIFGYDKSIDGYEYDLEKSKELLTEIGYPDGFDTKIWIDNNPWKKKIAENIKGQLEEVNINLDIEVLEKEDYLNKISSGDHDIFIAEIDMLTGDGDYGLYRLFHTLQHGNGGNRTFYSNMEVDNLLNEGRIYSSQEERLDRYKEIQNKIKEDGIIIPLYFENLNIGIQDYIEGIELSPTGYHSMYKADFK